MQQLQIESQTKLCPMVVSFKYLLPGLYVFGFRGNLELLTEDAIPKREQNWSPNLIFPQLDSANVKTLKS